MHTAAILSIGDELVLGQTLDTNSAWISQRLASVGVPVRYHQTVGDTQADIERMLREAAALSDFVIVSGGIGPTDDDLTRQSLAAVMGVELEADPAWLAHMTAWFAKLGRVMPPANVVQAGIPRGAKAIWNPNGTAAGVDATLKVDGRDVRVFVMPGVPKEMKAMFDADVFPHVAKAAGGGVILQAILHTFGVGESTIGERLGDLMNRKRNPRVGTTVSGGVVSVRINASFPTVEEATAAVNETKRLALAALGDVVYGEGADTLASVTAAELRAARQASPITVATAESCTGGLVAKMLTDEAGSSDYVAGGWVTYSNEMKTSQLGAPADLIAQHGAVSEPVAVAMAEGARQRAGATFAVAVTGIAGPGGATETKPVGTVCFGVAGPGGTTSRKFVFPGDREMVRDRSAKMALTLLRFALTGRPLPF
jgi:nicotinamide-nucleotide amidase